MKSRNQEMDMLVGRQIRLQRNRKGVSLRELADEIGVTIQDISDYELGRKRARAEQLFDLATALDVPLSYLFSETPGAVAMGRPRVAAGRL